MKSENATPQDAATRKDADGAAGADSLRVESATSVDDPPTTPAGVAPNTQHSEGEPEFYKVGNHHQLCRFPDGSWSLRYGNDGDHIRYLNGHEVSMLEAIRAQLEEARRERGDLFLKVGTLSSQLDAAESALREATNKAWIPCSERLPEDEIVVLVYEPGRSIQKTCRYGKDWLLPHRSNVTHWMPLPQPPLKTPPVEG